MRYVMGIAAVVAALVIFFGVWTVQMMPQARYDGTQALVSLVPYLTLFLIVSFVLGSLNGRGGRRR